MAQIDRICCPNLRCGRVRIKAPLDLCPDCKTEGKIFTFQEQMELLKGKIANNDNLSAMMKKVLIKSINPKTYSEMIKKSDKDNEMREM